MYMLRKPGKTSLQTEGATEFNLQSGSKSLSSVDSFPLEVLAQIW